MTDDVVLETLRGVSTATISMQLLKRGIRACAMVGPKPLAPDGARLVGPAYTLRYVPMREDLSTVDSLGAPDNAQKLAIEECPPGHVLVIDGRGRADTGVLGDILVGRLKARGVAGAVTDSAIRDEAGVTPIGLPVFCAGSAPPPNIGGLAWGDRQVRIGCGGVAVEPGDIVVGDRDGVVVIPKAFAADVARDGAEQEAFEAWVQDQVARGRAIPGLYPPSPETRAEYEAWRKGR
jgi:regulator of RNase E activity RraA